MLPAFRFVCNLIALMVRQAGTHRSACRARGAGLIAMAIVVAAVLLAGRIPAQQPKLAPAPLLAGPTAPGTPLYPDAGLRFTGDLGWELNVIDSAIDQAERVVYMTPSVYTQFGQTHGRVIKVDLGDGASAPRRLETLALEQGPNGFVGSSSAYDMAHGYGYTADVANTIYATNTTTRVHMFALGGRQIPMRAVGWFDLSAEDGRCYKMLIDSAGGYLYLICKEWVSGITRCLKYRLGNGDVLPTRVGSVELDSDASFAWEAVLDAPRGQAFVLFMLSNSNTRIIQIDLGDADSLPIRVGELPTETGEGYASGLLIDSINGHLYFRVNATPIAKLVKWALNPDDALPTRVATTSIDAWPSAIDASRGLLYCVGPTVPASNARRIIKMTSGEGNAAPGTLSTLTMQPGEKYGLALIDPVSGYGLINASQDYFFSSSYADTNIPAKLIKIRLGEGSEAPQRLDSLTLAYSDERFTLALFDDVNNYAYLVTQKPLHISGNFAPRVVKVRLDGPQGTATRVNSLTLPIGLDGCKLGGLDERRGVAYLHFAGKIVKIGLGTGDSAPTLIGVTPTPFAFSPVNACYDFDRGYGYMLLNALLYRFVLGRADQSVTNIEVTSVTLGSRGLAIDTTNGFIYQTSDTAVLKIDLGTSSTLPKVVSRLAVPSGGDGLVLDLAASEGFAYNSSTISKFSLNDDASTPTLLASLQLSSDLGSLHTFPMAAVTDTTARVLFITTYKGTPIPGTPYQSYRKSVLKLGLRTGLAAPVVLGNQTMQAAVEDSHSLHANARSHMLSLVTDELFGNVSQRDPYNLRCYRYGYNGAVRMTRVTIPEGGALRYATLYSHARVGNVRLGIYREDGPSTRTLVWQSNSTSNTQSAGFVEIGASAGSPANLMLTPGTYHLAWQVDTAADVPSYSAGGFGDGAMLSQPYGVFPPQMLATPSGADTATSWTTTAERWTGYIAYGNKAGIEREAWTHYEPGEPERP